MCHTYIYIYIYVGAKFTRLVEGQEGYNADSPEKVASEDTI